MNVGWIHFQNANPAYKVRQLLPEINIKGNNIDIANGDSNTGLLTVDFRNTVIVMTSNLGSQLIQEMAGAEQYDAMKAAVMEIVGQQFRPEFVNRIDDVVVFHPLGKDHIRDITDIQIDYLRQKLQAQNMKLNISDVALDRLGEAGFNPVYGARPLKRAIQQNLENPLAQ